MQAFVDRLVKSSLGPTAQSGEPDAVMQRQAVCNFCQDFGWLSLRRNGREEDSVLDLACKPRVRQIATYAPLQIFLFTEAKVK
jgi:hypothetical protein